MTGAKTDGELPVVAIASSFTSAPIEEALVRALEVSGVRCTVALAQYGQLHQQLLASPAQTVVATVVLYRIEDALRLLPLASSTEDPMRRTLREAIRANVDELVEQVRVAAERSETPVLFCCCPSRGWFATKHALVTLCQTFSVMLSNLVTGRTRAHVLSWQAFEAAHRFDGDIGDPAADRMAQIPFTQECFDALGPFLAGQLGDAVAATPAEERSAVIDTAALRGFLESLHATVALAPAADDRVDTVSSLSRASTEFNLCPGFKSRGDLERLLEDARRAVMVVEYTDRFGDLGACGFVVTERDGRELQVRDLLLTCPALGKELEYAVVLRLLASARDTGCESLRFVSTAPGPARLARRFLDRLRGAAGHTTLTGAMSVPFELGELERAVLAVSAAPATVVRVAGA